MTAFLVSYTTNSGRRREMTVKADSPAIARRELRKRGILADTLIRKESPVTPPSQTKRPGFDLKQLLEGGITIRDKALFAKLAAGDWMTRHQNLAIIGTTGLGKSWLACALGHKACRDDRSVLYHRVPRLFDALALARGDGRHARMLKTLSRVDLLILDDWGLSAISQDQARDLLEIIDDRHGRGSTIVTSQLAVEHWHELIPNPTIADAILDRLVHNAHRLILTGESIRKTEAKRAGLDAKK